MLTTVHEDLSCTIRRYQAFGVMCLWNSIHEGQAFKARVFKVDSQVLYRAEEPCFDESQFCHHPIISSNKLAWSVASAGPSLLPLPIPSPPWTSLAPGSRSNSPGLVSTELMYTHRIQNKRNLFWNKEFDCGVLPHSCLVFIWPQLPSPNSPPCIPAHRVRAPLCLPLPLDLFLFFHSLLSNLVAYTYVCVHFYTHGHRNFNLDFACKRNMVFVWVRLISFNLQFYHFFCRCCNFILLYS